MAHPPEEVTASGGCSTGNMGSTHHWIFGDTFYTYRSTGEGEQRKSVIVGQCSVDDADPEDVARVRARQQHAEEIMAQGTWSQKGETRVWTRN